MLKLERLVHNGRVYIEDVPNPTYRIYVGRRREGDWERTALGLWKLRGGYNIYFDHGMMTELRFINDYFQPISLRQRNDEVLQTIAAIQDEWARDEYRAIFTVDKYAGEHMPRFREIWDTKRAA